MEKKVFGISKIDAGRRIYVPKTVLEELEATRGDYVHFKLGKRPAIEKAIENSDGKLKIDVRQRVYVPNWLMEALKTAISKEVIFIKEGRDITISRLESRIR